jgi:hypothetical protein
MTDTSNSGSLRKVIIKFISFGAGILKEEGGGKPMWKIAIIVSLVLLITSPAFAATTTGIYDGNELLSQCKEAVKVGEGRVTGVNYFDAGYCLGVIMTVNFMWGDTSFCIPAKVTNDQEVRVVVKFLNDHPEQLHISEFLLVNGALVNVWPCKKK